ncbi:MAG: MBOAT family protein [Bacteroidales bacterium]|nr:MBOAT family protein [Bacteroidales bacterium]
MVVEFLKRIFSFDPNSPLLFTQFDFWVFFALVFTLFSLFKNKVLLRNTFIFFVSVFFYYKTSGWATIILVSATLLNFLLGLAMPKRKTEGGRVVCLLIGLLLNLGILCYFKYAYFFAEMLHGLFGVTIPVVNVFAEIGNVIAGKDTFTVDKIILPVGISFYTFQCVSYIMDVFRRKVEPVSNLLNFGFYITFFPQLVAGPIIRAADFVPQIYKKYFLSRRQFGIAVFWILNGMAKKIILSDYLAVNFVDRVFENPLLYTGFENLVALFAYSLQVYADFSGYTDIAIGVAMIMGFHLPRNFNSPYKATNPGEFWKRWHISLSNWLQA